MKKIVRFAIIISAILPLVVMPIIVQAISSPDSSPTISNIHVSRNLIETGDQLYYFDYNIPYTSIPSVGADETFIFRLIDTDNTTELGAIQPYVLMDNGYNEGVGAFYFAAADNLTWGELYIIRISENPSHFAAPTSIDFVISADDYTTYTDQEDNQIELAINIIGEAQRLETYHTSYTFLDTGAGGTVLYSPTGETYFRGVIYGVQAMAPSLFLVQTLDIATSHTYAVTQAETYASRFDATWVGASENATETQFGIEGGSVLGMAFIFPICAGGIVLSSWKFRKAEPGFVAASVILIMGLLMGWLPYAIFASLYQAMGIYLAYVWFYSRG